MAASQHRQDGASNSTGLLPPATTIPGNNSHDDSNRQLSLSSRSNHEDPNGGDPNNSDSPASSAVDFISFPTIPDPENDNSKTLTKIFTKTLRKVTNNASHLVQTYSSPKQSHNLNPDEIISNDHISDKILIHPPILTATPIIKDEAKNPALHKPKPTHSVTAGAKIQANSISDQTFQPPGEIPAVSDILRRSTPSRSEDNHLVTVPRSSSNATVNIQPVSQRLTTADLSKNDDNVYKLPAKLPDESTSRVTSDGNGLRLSNIQNSNLQTVALSRSATSSVINVTALANTDKEAFERRDTSNSSLPQTSQKLEGAKQETLKQTLQNKISSIFNNLPNDIELSDDSASDTETINNVSLSSSPAHQNHLQQNLINPNEISMYSEATSIPSPIKAERGRSIKLNSSTQSPTLSSFHALRNGQSPYPYKMKKMPSSNLSSVLLDNAKSIINNNLAGAVVSSASSMVTKKKKKKPKTISENPLKNGGIPKKYWMNDAFVSDCLNCFRPFTAFRRKHHCRFCGQIFCSDCTLFISYNQHKEQAKAKTTQKKHSIKNNDYNDKLRVCKPCYDDVIVYLSDDSSSSSASDGEFAIEEELGDEADRSYTDYSAIPDHPLSRIRTLSINSRRDSLLGDSLVGNKKLSSMLSNESRTTLNPSSPVSNNAFAADLSATPSSSRIVASGANIHESPKYYSKQAPQMAIPTTRKGESLEIPVAKSSYSNTVSNSMSNLAMIAMNNSVNNNIHANSAVFNNGDAEFRPQSLNSKNSWFKNHGLRNKTVINTDSSNSSLDNFSHLYNNFLGRKNSGKLNRTHSQSEKDLRGKKSDNNISKDDIRRHGSSDNQNSSEAEIDDQEEEEEDIESENEDEKVMSMYTSLHDPRPSALSVSTASIVPTLSEFPTMSTTDKRFPRGFNAPKHTIGVSFFEDRPISETKSKERAHASLMRMQSRRKSRSVRNILVMSHGRSSTLDNPSLRSPSPISNPASPSFSQANYSSLTRGLSNQSSTNNVPTLTMSHSSGDIDYIDRSLADHTFGSNPSTPRLTFDKETDKDIEEELEAFLPPDNETLDMQPLETSLLPHDEISFTVPSNEMFYQNLIDHMLRQSLEDCEIHENQEKWKNVLERALSYINQLRITDTLDVKQYTKIKKNMGGTIEDTSVVDGLFITKNIDSKKMSSKIENPRIAVLMFPVEYLKQKEQFISLRIIHSQQTVYITNLVSRLISLEPDVVVVGDTVCGLAEKLLEEANITVVSNVKPQAVERISRYTKADIFQTINDLFFKKAVLGTCKLFEVKKYVYQNTVKTFTYFTGSDIQSGFTICLRGGDEESLNSVKYATETLMSAVFNARFEKRLLEDHNLKLISNDTTTAGELFTQLENTRLEQQQDGNEIDDVLVACNNSLDNHEIGNYIKLFNERVISTSPCVNFQLPVALLDVVEAYQNINKLFKVNQRIKAIASEEDIDSDLLEELKINVELDQLPNKFDDLLSIIKFVSEFNLNSLVQIFYSRIRVWANCMRYTSYQLYPLFHKKIHFLHSTVSIKHATPCTGPSIVVVDYYTDNDKGIGWYLDQIFRESSKICDECGESLLNHYKTYVHGNSKIDLIIERYDKLSYDQDFKGKNQRVMWSSCKQCNYSTPIVTMSDETSFYSIGKFLELCFWGQDAFIDAKHCCSHDFFKNHIRYFAFNDLVIRLEFSKIDSYEVVVPRKKLEFIPQIDINLKIESFNNIQTKTSTFFQSVSKRLNRVKVDTFDKAEAGIKRVEELKLKLDTQIQQFKQKALDIYNSTPPMVHLPLNSVLRDLQELAVEWDIEFNDFEKSFLPTENEITKITQFHLRNFLIDKYNNDEEKKEVELDDMPKADNEKSVETSSKEIKQVEDSEEHEVPEVLDDDGNGPEKADFPMASLSKATNLQPNILDKIHKMEQLLDQERLKVPDDKKINKTLSRYRSGSLNHKASESSLSLTATPSVIHDSPTPGPVLQQIRQLHPSAFLDEDGKSLQNAHPIRPGLYPNASSSKVQDLAKYYNEMNLNQLSQEFKERRERELEKRPTKIKAFPIMASKPIVEIYNKIEDVVDVDEATGGGMNNNNNTKQGKRSVGPDSKEMKQQTPTESKREEINLANKNEKDRIKTNIEKEVNRDKLDIPQPEKNSLLKSLTTFWADRSATLWDPLNYPLDSNEHTFADSDVIVREDEPSSLVAFCLSSNDYKQKIQSMVENDDLNNVDVNEEMNEINKTKNLNFMKIEKKFKKKINNDDYHYNELEMIMAKTKSNHLKYQFIDGNTNLSCKIFYSEQFEAFRKSCGTDESFIQSLSRCVKWNSSGGKSGSNFLKTLDNRYIVKELSKSELESFVSIAPFYFRYISQSMFNTLSTAIAKIFGFYQIHIKNSITGKTFRMDFLIMENLFYNHKTTRIFDLKGSMRNRHVKQTGKENEVLLDENMIEYIYESPVFVNEQLKKLLRGSLFNDTSFLSAMDVMDYSLVIGIDDSLKKLYIGIIDWLRTFTWDKKVENWVKGNSLVGGGKGKDPTIVTPKQYRIRFREAMERYILEVPDIWYEGK